MFFNANAQDTGRGLDTPSTNILHDDASLSDAFLRTITRLTPNDTLAINLSNQYNTYQIPINATPTSVDSIVNVAGQDDVQREYSAFATLNYTHTSRDGRADWQVIPWFAPRASRTPATLQTTSWPRITARPTAIQTPRRA